MHTHAPHESGQSILYIRPNTWFGGSTESTLSELEQAIFDDTSEVLKLRLADVRTTALANSLVPDVKNRILPSHQEQVN